MKKIILMAACVIAFAACDNGATKRAAQERDSLMQVIDAKDSELNEIMGTLNEIQDGFKRINEAEGRITVADGDLESATSKEVIRENMQFIQDALAQNKEMIAKLKDKLRTSSINSDKLKQTVNKLSKELEEQTIKIKDLEKQLAEKDILIAQQGAAIDSLNTNVEQLTAENANKSQTVAEQDKMLNTAWYVFGTKAELKEQKILKNGDVLQSGDFNKDYFTKIDIRYDKVLNLYSKSAKLLTNHPEGSYAIKKDKNNQCYLQITNPAEFWSVSKYLVVKVK